jgi:hypothetical protein
MVVIQGIELDALNYTIKVPYNGTGPTGGNSLTENLNIWYEVCYRLDGNRNAAAVAIRLTALSTEW